MKQYAGMGINFARSIKYSKDDQNEEAVYAELNLIVTETTYDISNVGNIVRSKAVDEVELIVTANTAREMANALADVADKLEEIEEREAKRDLAWKEYNDDL